MCRTSRRSVHRGSGSGHRIWRATSACSTRPSRKLRQQAQDSLAQVAARKGQPDLQHLAAGGNRAGLSQLCNFDKGAVNHAHWRRNSVSLLNVALRPRCSTCTFVCGRCAGSRACPLARARAGQSRYRDTPGKHRGHLRGHRIRAGLGGLPAISRPVQDAFPERFERSAFPRVQVSASRRRRRKAPIGSRARRSIIRSASSARASRSCTRATS